VEESKVACNKVMHDTCCLVQDVDLAVENIFGLFRFKLRDVAYGARLNAVEARRYVGGRVGGLSSDASGGEKTSW
jgi:hypothetical protein